MSSDSISSKERTFSCQSVNLVRASSAAIWDIQQHIWEMSLRERGKLKPLKFIHMLLSSLSFKIRKFSGLRNRYILSGTLKRTPTASLNLQPGELVEVKRKEEILATLDFDGRNRGLGFDPEMQKYCGGRYRVLKRLDNMINEETGQMRQIANTVILEGVVCNGEFHGGCQRTCYCLWREIWLKRV